jgi:hypothetical protein
LHDSPLDLTAVRTGRITLEEALQRYQLTELRRVQSMPVGAALGRLMRIARVGVAITLSG